MFIDIYIQESDKKGETIYLFNDVLSRKDLYAYSLFDELINIKDGLWKDKKLVSIDGCWGELKVTKEDILYFIDEVNAKYTLDREEFIQHQAQFLSKEDLNRLKKSERKDINNSSEKQKVMELDEDKSYWLVAIESQGLLNPEAFQLDVKIIPDDDETKLSNGFIYIYQ